jgi:hypothetical protein
MICCTVRIISGDWTLIFFFRSRTSEMNEVEPASFTQYCMYKFRTFIRVFELFMVVSLSDFDVILLKWYWRPVMIIVQPYVFLALFVYMLMNC